MPTIAFFYGIAIQMFYDDHNPPHLHARYGRARALVRLSDGEIIAASYRPSPRGWFETGRWHGALNWKRIGAVLNSISLLRRWQVPMPTNDFPMVDVIRLRPLEGHRLWLRFTDGSEGVRDLSGVTAKGGVMVAPLQEQTYFDRVFVEMGAPTWPNGFDLDPIALYMELRDAGELSRVAAE